MRPEIFKPRNHRIIKIKSWKKVLRDTRQQQQQPRAAKREIKKGGRQGGSGTTAAQNRNQEGRQTRRHLGKNVNDAVFLCQMPSHSNFSTEMQTLSFNKGHWNDSTIVACHCQHPKNLLGVCSCNKVILKHVNYPFFPCQIPNNSNVFQLQQTHSQLWPKGFPLFQSLSQPSSVFRHFPVTLQSRTVPS